MFKEFFMKKMLQKQGVSDDQINLVLNMVNKDPELFKRIALEAQEEMKKGKDQMAAMMEVMMRHKDEVGRLMGDEAPKS